MMLRPEDIRFLADAAIYRVISSTDPKEMRVIADQFVERLLDLERGDREAERHAPLFRAIGRSRSCK